LALAMDREALKTAFSHFKGIGRRSEFIGEVRGVKFFDDYAHHPTAVAAILESFRTSYPDRTLWAIMEPHQISRIRLFLNEFALALDKADTVIITKTFVGREKYKNIKELDMNVIIEKIGSHKAKYLEDFDSVADFVELHAKTGDIVVVIGAGNSYKLTQKIMKQMNPVIM
jgi:UDP-N-acetylmuramate--alanine ligase